MNMDRYSNVPLLSGIGKRDLGEREPEDTHRKCGANLGKPITSVDLTNM